tara:strand:+ start:63 stop:284 length:222 start_codon:yes stop_codon:yes gene_type:complete
MTTNETPTTKNTWIERYITPEGLQYSGQCEHVPDEGPIDEALEVLAHYKKWDLEDEGYTEVSILLEEDWSVGV